MMNNLNVITMGDQQLRSNIFYGYVYLTLNLVNRKRYIGVHKVSDGKLDPKYKGSGVLLRKAIEKYGEENFKTRPIKWCSCENELFQAEADLIQKYDCVNSDKYYNIHSGGKGGRTWANYDTDFDKSKVIEKIRNKASNRPRTEKELLQLEKLHADRIGTHHSEESKLKSKISNLGQHRSEETKRHLSENHADVSGENNPCYGKICVNNGLKNKFILPEELPTYLQLGFVKGMVSKHHHISGKAHSNFGKRSRYMNKDGKNKMVSYDDVAEYLTNGWVFGKLTYKQKDIG